MNRLLNKDEIENYDAKANFLREKGWTDHWDVDNWIKTEWRKTHVNIDHAGVSLEYALRQEGYYND